MSYRFEDFAPAGREQLGRALAHAAMLREHTARCVALRMDPGAVCICRPPACLEPLKPTEAETELAVRGQR